MDNSQNSPILIRPDAYKLIPSCMWSTYVCSVMYDGYPRNNKNIDITICLRDGRVIELFQSECISSIKISVSNFKEIRAIRNVKGDLFYLVVANSEVIVLSSSDQLSIYRRYPDVKHYEVCDPECTGEAQLKIVTETGTLYTSFYNTNDVSQQFDRHMEHTKPVVSALERKLIEAKYNLKCHEKALKQMEELRQYSSFSCHEEDALKLISKPIIKFCNKKIIIQLEVENLYETLNKVCVLIHNSSCNSISYTSKVFKHLSTSPFYKENEFREIQSKHKASIVAVIPLSEFKSSISSRIDFSMVVSYERHQKCFLQAFDDVHISAGDVMGNNFDVFNSPQVDVHNICMAMLSTTVKTVLCLKHKLDTQDMISLSTVFRKYLKMALIGETKTVAIHRHSPHHILHGIMIIFDDNNGCIDSKQNEINYNIDVYTRSSSQVLALIHFIYDAVPLTLIVTTPNVQVSPIADADDGGSIVNTQKKLSYTHCINSLLNQCSLTLKYLDDCLNEMNKRNNVDLTDIKIDLFAMGREEFVKYRNSMLAEAKKGFEDIVKSSSETCGKNDDMEVD